MTGSGRATRARIIDHFQNERRSCQKGDEDDGDGDGDSGGDIIEEAMGRYRRWERLGCTAGQLFFVSKMLPPALTRWLYPFLERIWLRNALSFVVELNEDVSIHTMKMRVL